MAEKYMIDSSIWRDFHENRSDKYRPLGEWAFELFKKIRINKKTALYCDLTLDELGKAYKPDEIKKIFNVLSEGGLLEKVDTKKEQAQEAAKLCRERKLPFGDCLYAVLARDNKAIMVARDAHFLELTDIADVKKPEELV